MARYKNKRILSRAEKALIAERTDRKRLIAFLQMIAESQMINYRVFRRKTFKWNPITHPERPILLIYLEMRSHK